MISVDSASPVANVFCIPLCDMLRAIPTFKSSFQDLTIKCKSMVLIANIGMDLSRINLDIHKYNLDSDAELSAAPNFVLSSSPGTPPLSTRAYAAFINVATKTESTSKVAAKEQEKVIL